MINVANGVLLVMAGAPLPLTDLLDNSQTRMGQITGQSRTREHDKLGPPCALPNQVQ